MGPGEVRGGSGSGGNGLLKDCLTLSHDPVSAAEEQGQPSGVHLNGSFVLSLSLLDGGSGTAGDVSSYVTG